MEIYQNVTKSHLEIQKSNKMTQKIQKDLHMSIICSIFAADFGTEKVPSGRESERHFFIHLKSFYHVKYQF